ncbi:hypothetical protein HCA58_13585 [Micromonospora sp. HNM0581]|uniref:hypothetical protein n=1 Tax=Micromonospora sp. HNM0581 TaxID=2716341 RepID=UPI00146AD993|nr:hypothetical protein [Micromonospora sp. HNM0581]NLU79395.1 hypothetical protein [Micromonospora sp. HNM0581]
MLTAVQVLAQNNFGDTRTGGLAGPMGLFLILVLSAATVLLIRNMNARLRRLPDRFPGQGPTASDVESMDRAVGDPTGGIVTEDSSADAPNRHQQRRDG